MHNFLTLSLIFSLSFAPIALAQEVAEVALPASAETPAAETIPAEPQADTLLASAQEAVPAGESSTPAPAESSAVSEDPAPDVAVQETVTTQDAATSTVLQATTDPQDIPLDDALSTVPILEDPAPAATSSDPLLVPEATSTPETDPLLVEEEQLDVVADIPEEVPAEPVPATEEAVAEPQPARIAEKDLAPQPEFAFALTGKKVATKKLERSGGRDVEQTVTAPLTTEVDNVKGEMRLSGSCAAPYYVVLVFKHQEDYANDPRSYVVNRAYACENGVFSYALSDLPDTLPSGTYYVLIGEQGETSAWKPVTELTEFSITNR